MNLVGARRHFTYLVLFVLISLLSANSQRQCTGIASLSAHENSPGPTQQLAIIGLFEEFVLADNSDHILSTSIRLPDEQRYAILSKWVLPSQQRDSIRLTAQFASATARHVERRATDNIASPALDLIAVAKRIGRVAGLIEKTRAIPSHSETQQRARLALLTLLSIAAEDFDAATETMNALYDRHRIKVFADLKDRWPETLVVAEAIHHPRLREATEEVLLRMLQDQVRPGKNNGPDPWDRLIPSLLGQLKLHKQALHKPTSFGAAPRLHNWFPVSAKDFGTHGLGFPAAHWEWDGESIRLLSHHNNDYLYFCSPLTGDYEIECESTGFDYRESQLLVAGTWVVPSVSHEAYFSGHVGSDLPMGTISPKLSEITDWMRLQAKVTNDHCEFFVDGRLIHKQPLSQNPDPWLAVRVPFSTYGRVRDLCITGNPVIPESIRLSDNDQLNGWTSYYGGGIGDRRYHDWWHETDEAGIGMIVGLNSSARFETAKESLLQYQRPVLEDGEIDYEFYFDPGKSHVHPAIGRDVLLLRREGVAVHQITDAHFDRTDTDPLNQRAPGSVDSDVQPLPLKSGEWNHTRLKIRGDVLEVRVNKQLVYRGTLTALRNERTFGLFHYDGDTEIRVRNVEWRGDWPKTLPPLSEQELRDKTADVLDRVLPELTAEFSHDFAKQGLPLSRFQIQDQGADQYVSAKADGLHINAEMKTKGYSRVCVTPLLIVEGDFDMTAAFDALNINPTKHGLCNAMLQIALTDEPISHHAISMMTNIDPGRFPQRMVYHDLLQLKPFHQGLLAKRSEEVTSGTLRLARRGDRIYSMIAPENSKVFRLIHVENCATQPSRFDGARLVAGMNSSAEGISKVSIIWKNLHIRAKKLTGPAVSKKLRTENKR